MKKSILLTAVFCVLSCLSFGQISYERGYYISLAGDTVNGLIRSDGWRSNPYGFRYKINEDAEIKMISPFTCKEVGFEDGQRFINATVSIDQSAKNNIVNSSSEPDFSDEIVFLKVLIEGKGSLYKYEYKENVLYFYSYEGGEKKQLIYKKYEVAQNTFGANDQYKQQLWMNFRYPESTIKEFDLLHYTQRDLVNVFKKFNESQSADFKDYSQFEKGLDLNLTIRPGISRSSVYIENEIRDTRDLDFGSATNLRIGLELEVILPFHKNKWGIFVEPTYQYFTAKHQLDGQEVIFDYQSVEIPIGVRHYFFVGQKSKLFINTAAVIDFSWNSIIEHERYSDLVISGTVNVAFGGGYMFNDRFSVEFRYYTPRNILANYPDWRSYYSTSSLILGYAFF